MKKSNSGQVLWLLTFALGLAIAIPACGGDDGDDGEKYAQCTLEDGTHDCGNPACDKAPVCQRGCKAQVPTCEPTIHGRRIDRICAGGSCEAAGPWGEDGGLARGNLVVQHSFDVFSVPSLRSFALTAHHGVRPKGGKLTCADLLDLDDLEDPGASNILARTVDNVQAESGSFVRIPLNDIPITEGDETVLIFTRFFSVTKDEHGEPRGNIAGRACIEKVSVPEGPYVEDEAHSPQIVVKPACDARDPNACKDGKVCVAAAGMCRYQCEPTCKTSAEVCRPRSPGEAPECLRRCYPDSPSQAACPVDEICNSNVGEEPACLPL